MYSKDGSFGRVRLATREFPNDPALFHLGFCGWHDCNDQYCIHRKEYIVPLLLYTVGGQGEMNIGGQHFDLPAGTLAFIPRGATGFYRTPKGGRWEFYWVHPKGETAENLLQTLGAGALCASADDIRHYARDVEELLRLCPQTSPHTDVKISMVLSRLLHQSILDLQTPKEPSTLAEKAMNYLSVHMNEPITLPQVAAALFVSEAHLGRVFKAEWGITPHQYLTRCRLRAANSLLRDESLTVQDIARLTGFCSPSHFVNAYKKLYGTTPAKYRQASPLRPPKKGRLQNGLF